jgi:hypothetical protein
MYVNPSSNGGGGVARSYLVDAFLDEAGSALERRGIEDGVFEGIEVEEMRGEPSVPVARRATSPHSETRSRGRVRTRLL